MTQSTKDKLRERLEADMARFFGDGGTTTEVPYGLSGEAQVRCEKKDSSRQRYVSGRPETQIQVINKTRRGSNNA